MSTVEAVVLSKRKRDRMLTELTTTELTRTMLLRTMSPLSMKSKEL